MAKYYQEILPSDCIGDSLPIINGNFFNFNTAVESLTANFPIATHNIQDDAVDNTKLRNSTGVSVIGRSASTTGDPADIVANADNHVLRRSGNNIGFGQVTTNGIADSAIISSKIATDAVGTSEIAANAVTASVIANNAVTEGKILNGSVTNSKIQDGSVTSGKIASSNISNIHIANNASIAGTKINPNFGGQNILTTGEVAIGTTDTRFGGLAVFDKIMRYRDPSSSQGNTTFQLDRYPPGGEYNAILTTFRSTGTDSGGILIIVGDNNGDEKAIDVWNGNNGGVALPNNQRPPNYVTPGLKFRVRSNGVVSAADYQGLSDRNKKTEIEDTHINGIDFINRFRVVDYLWKETAETDKNKKIGLIAQEVQEHYPASISVEGGSYYLDYNKFIGPLIKVSQELSHIVKEQQKTIESLTQRVNELETKQ